MKRREFITLVGGAAAATGVRNILFARDQTPPSDALEGRLADIITAYDAQGNHRTATSVDDASAEWLAKEVRQAGAEPSLEPFTLSRIDPLSCYVRMADRRIDGVPLFDASFTGADGVRGTLGPVGSDAEIGLAETEPSRLTQPGSEVQRARVAEVRQARHKAVILITRGVRPGLFLLNAPAFKAPVGPPVLQVSSAEAEWLKAQAQQRAEVTLVARVERTPAQAFNVVAQIAGSDPSLAPLVITTPRSGWWQCASERGSGIACWVETIRLLATERPLRDCFFVAMSGHELGGLGGQAYLEHRGDLGKRALAFIQFGANIGAPRQPNLIQASDDALEQWAVAAMEREGLTVNRKAAHDATPFGEAAIFKRAGGRYVAPVCDNDVFHNQADRWPDAVDVAALARYARPLPTAHYNSRSSGVESFHSQCCRVGSESAKRASLGTSDMIKRRVFLGGTLSAVAVESCKSQSAEAPVPTAAIQPLEPLVWPIVTKLPDGIRAFAGHVNTVPDIVGTFGRPPSLVIFTEGNHLMALLSEEIVGGAFPSWAKSQSRYADLNLDNVVAVTLPQPIVVQTIRTGAIALGNLTLEFTRASGFYPDIVMGGPAPLQALRKLGAVEPQARFFSRNRGRALLVRKGNPLGIRALADIARTGARVAQADSVEAGARAGNRAAVEALIGKPAADAFFANEVEHFPGRLGVTHRDVPEMIARGYAEVGLTQYHLISYWVRTFPNHFELVPIEGAERFSVKIAFGRVIDPLRPRARDAFEEFFFSRAREVYPRYEFARMSDDEYGATLVLD